MSRFDFDTPVNRRGSGSYKWDDTDDNEVIPLWVADMDFRTAPVVVEALRRRVDHGVFGYTLVQDSYYEALIRWFESRHGFSFNRSQVIYTSGVVPALSAIIKALVPAGSGVAVQTPVYNCFFSSIRNNGCFIADSPLKRVDTGQAEFTYRMDFDALEKVCADPAVKLLLLCNPHNPAGRCWTRQELERVAEITSRNSVMVVSDEIHCELTMPGHRYVPYATVDSSAIVCISPSKAFNTAGLQIANIVCPSPEIRAAIDKAININEVCDVNPFGPVALEASYSSEGERWLTQLKDYLWHNWLYTKDFITSRLPQCSIATLEATYLPWVDVSALSVDSETLEEELKNKAKVWINAGEMYGSKGYIRINIACPRTTLAEGLGRLCNYLEKL
ncbi:MAG: pyridoxal phosphate-dependent aminotransferase [Muribaculaceae bacterium]|nr:pyridoxal phosphate-dependent aminotransferase [Muribaculaceae bacterium]